MVLPNIRYTQCSGDDSSPCNVAITTRADERYTPPRHVIPRERKRVEESSRVADFILWWFIVQRGGFLHSADAAVGMTILERFYGFAHCFWNVSRCTAFPHQSRPLGRASFPRGKLLYRAFGTLVFRYGVKVCTKTFPFGEGGPP